MAEITVETLALHLQEYWARSARRREPIIWADLARDTLALIGEPTGRTEAEVKADQIDHLIDRFYAGDKNYFVLPYSVLDWLRSQPEYQARYGSAAAIRGEQP